MTLDQLRLMADTVSTLDGLSRRGDDVDRNRRAMIDAAHDAIIAALGRDVDLVYARADEDEPTPA
jgi:hypothetical protein